MRTQDNLLMYFEEAMNILLAMAYCSRKLKSGIGVVSEVYDRIY